MKRAGVTTICVLHEADDAVALGDRIAVMYAGRVVQIGTLKDLLQRPKDDIVTRLLTSHLLS